MLQATQRMKLMGHITERLPQLKIYENGVGQLTALLKYKDIVVETEISDKLFNKAEIDYHDMVVDKLVGKLAAAIKFEVPDDKVDPGRIFEEAQSVASER